jgi:hypothetical protein
MEVLWQNILWGSEVTCNIFLHRASNLPLVAVYSHFYLKHPKNLVPAPACALLNYLFLIPLSPSKPSSQ